MDATSFLVLAGSVNRLVEALKPSLANASRSFGWSDAAYNALVQTVSVLLGVIIAFVAGGANLFPASVPFPQWLEVAGTGIVVGLGADVVNLVIDFLYSWMRPAPVAPPVPTPPAPPA